MAICKITCTIKSNNNINSLPADICFVTKPHRNKYENNCSMSSPDPPAAPSCHLPPHNIYQLDTHSTVTHVKRSHNTWQCQEWALACITGKHAFMLPIWNKCTLLLAHGQYLHTTSSQRYFTFNGANTFVCK